MDTNIKKQNAILYIEKDKGTLFFGGKDPLVMRFPKDIVANLEIVDKTKFQQMIVHFLSTHEVKPMLLLIVLSPEVLFEKILDNMPLSVQHIEKEKFLDTVPFNTILAKIFRIQNKAHLVAANKDFVETLVQVLQEESSTVVGTVAFSSIQKKLPEIKENTDLPKILKKIDTFKNYSLLLPVEHADRAISYKVPSLKNPQFIALISVFVLLLAVLGFEVYTQLVSQNKVVTPKSVEKVVRRITPLPPVTTISVAPSITSEEK